MDAIFPQARTKRSGNTMSGPREDEGPEAESEKEFRSAILAFSMIVKAYGSQDGSKGLPNVERARRNSGCEVDRYSSLHANNRKKRVIMKSQAWASRSMYKYDHGKGNMHRATPVSRSATSSQWDRDVVRVLFGYRGGRWENIRHNITSRPL